MQKDLTELLSSLLDEKVDFLIVGGLAVTLYSEPRYTKDVDILVGTHPENRTRMHAAFKNFGAPSSSLGSFFDDPESFIILGIAPNRMDFLNSIPGVSFAEAWERRNMIHFDGLLLPFISADDLIIAKRASGRPQDLLDAEAIELQQNLLSKKQTD